MHCNRGIFLKNCYIEMNINFHLEKQEMQKMLHSKVDVEMLSIPRKDGGCSLIKAKKLSEKNEQPYHISTTWKIF